MSGKSSAIVTVCPRCRKESEVRGLDWSDITNAADEAFAMEGLELAATPTISRMCANCRFRTQQEKKPLTPEQKQVRALYNKQRNERIKVALELLKQQEGASS